jgi:hypothetical protein
MAMMKNAAQNAAPQRTLVAFRELVSLRLRRISPKYQTNEQRHQMESTTGGDRDTSFGDD